MRTTTGGDRLHPLLLQQPRDPFELCEETQGEPDSRFALVEPNCLCKILRREPVDGPIH